MQRALLVWLVIAVVGRVGSGINAAPAGEASSHVAPPHHSDNPFLNRRLGCEDLERVEPFMPFAHGQKKEVVRGALHGGVDGSEKKAAPLPVVIARPFNGDFWTVNKAGYSVKNLRAHYESYFRNERHLLMALDSEFAPHFYGGCWSSFRSTVLIEEYLRGFMDAACDPSVGFRQRLKVAAGAVRMLDLWDRFPVTNGSVVRAIYGDLFAKQFAVDAEMNVKVVDVQSFMAYNPQLAGFGADYPCSTDIDCEAQFWRTPGKPHVMRGLRGLNFDDFGCGRHGRCRGLDSQTAMAAVCLLLLDPLFELAPKHQSAGAKDALKAIFAILNACMQPKRAQRASRADILARLEALADDSKHNRVPPLNLTNANLKQYQVLKDKFETVRRRRAADILRAQKPKADKHAAVSEPHGHHSHHHE